MFLKSDSEVKAEILCDLGWVRSNTDETAKAIKELSEQTKKPNDLLRDILRELKAVSSNSDRSFRTIEKIRERIGG